MTQSIEDYGLEAYCVSLQEDAGDKFTIKFPCWADDPDHAEEQAKDAYPNCVILHIVKITREEYNAMLGN